VGRQSALHKKDSGFAESTLLRHISTLRGYRILFSIRNPYKIASPIIFLFIHNHLTSESGATLHYSTILR